ncbi:putative 2-dehydro-3-deoxygluconokinase [Vibrio sinaloensis DSM 21326]|uniref:2-dehydro-3-deoxygluconokinase n=1 Tax=Vibrio sinaloensis DSM 21326 TaxID=945550 RepID=E8MC97_PHOS4|nr:sugar kinase [Vibrio sinaloensis]EGA68402.1 putative 2-dehydro-3-deoxygluconokinase [Vibrio sinaloensis DSM 21326]
MKKIAVIGECMIELNGTPFGTMEQTFGGDTLNTAIYLKRTAKLNTATDKLDVLYITAMGCDPLSKAMIERWQKEGIDTRHVLVDDMRTAGLYMIQVDENGERTFLYWRNQSAARYLLSHPKFTQVKHCLEHVDAIFVSGISLAILSSRDRSRLLTLLEQLRSQGIEVIFDSNYRPALWPHDELASVRACYLTMYQTTNLALVTFEDEQRIWGDQSAQQTLTRLHSLGVKTVIVKQGDKGCLLSTSESTSPFYVPASAVSNVVDTTSAGDSFNGGFLAHYLAGSSLITACEYGNHLAGIVIQHKGAIIPAHITHPTYS